MKIIHFTDTYYPIVNGVSFAVEQYARTMAELGHEVVIVTAACSIRSREEKIGNLTIKRVRSIPFPIYPGFQAAIPNTVSLYNFVKDFSPDIIHIHTPFVLGVLGTIFGQIFKIPIVNTYHTLFSSTTMYLSPKRFFTRFHKDMKPDHSEKRVLNQITWRLQMIFFNLSDLVIAPTHVIAEQLEKHGLKAKLKTLPSGLDTKEFACKKDFSITKRIICLGRLGLEKSVDIVLKAFAQVLQHIPDAHLIIAGDGPARESLETLSKELRITQQVTFLGMVDHPQTPELYRSCDIFVSASTMETQGLVLLEAMLSGLPVVAAAVNAPIDLVEPGQNGYLFDENDVAACATHIEHYYKNPKQLQENGEYARTYALSFDRKTLTKKLVREYQKLTNRR